MAEPQTKTSTAQKTAGKGAEPRAAAQKLNFREFVPSTLNLDFVGKRYAFLVVSSILNVLAIVLFVTMGLNYGVDFRGGTDMRVRFSEPTSAAAVREELGGLDLRDLAVQDFGSTGREFLLRFEIEEGEQMSSIAQTLSGVFAKSHPGEKGYEILSTESVGPKVGAQLRQQGLMAVGFATVCMGIYIALRFQWSFGLGAVVALVHDVLITIGVLTLTRFSFDLTTLAALLTVVGFSVHDTIIVSDRIRETLRRNPKMDLPEAINRSINETLSRTLLTTGTVLLVLVAMALFAGATLRPFAVTLIVGFITGTYSSIYIAAPIVLLWTDRSKVTA
ncbi:MAG: protein translocase subunit SecF [Deltaproteobacteria bacterium]|nr:protein translocase subunit SecF [Deltaproteobacteria bacterium]